MAAERSYDAIILAAGKGALDSFCKAVLAGCDDG
jgi:hypothetical protein